MSGPRTLLRFSQVRRTERVDSPADEGQMALGRYFQADCLSSDAVGTFVYPAGLAVAGVPQVTKVDLLTMGKFPAIGMIVEKSSATRCLVQARGEVEVSPAVLIPGHSYFIGLDGLLSDGPPVPGSGTRAAIQCVALAFDVGRLLLNVHPTVFLRSG